MPAIALASLGPPRVKVALSALLIVASLAHAEPASVLVLRRPGFLEEGAAVVQALRIYTADLGSRIVVAGEAPATLVPVALVQVADQARQHHAAFVTWVNRRDGRLVLYLLHEKTLDLRETEVEPVGLVSAAEAQALKVRALLTGAGGGGASRPPEPAPPAGPPSAAAGAGQPAEAPTPRNQADVAAARPTPASREGPPSWLGLAASYGLWLPSETKWLRHGVRLAAELRPHGGRLSVYADGAITSRPTDGAGATAVTLRDVPIGLGATLRTHGERLEVAGGPRASLHVIDVSGDRPGAPPRDARRFSAGLGGLVAVELTLATHLHAFLGLTLEMLVPAQEFTVQRETVLRTGAALFSATAGVSAWLP